MTDGPACDKKMFKCSICEATWVPKRRNSLPQRCPRCKSKMWNKSYKHTCCKCQYSWVSASNNPDRCPGCQTRKWKDSDMDRGFNIRSNLPTEMRQPILLKYSLGQGCVKIAIDLHMTFSEVIDIINDTYPDEVPRL